MAMKLLLVLVLVGAVSAVTEEDNFVNPAIPGLAVRAGTTFLFSSTATVTRTLETQVTTLATCVAPASNLPTCSARADARIFAFFPTSLDQRNELPEARAFNHLEPSFESGLLVDHGRIIEFLPPIGLLTVVTNIAWEIKVTATVSHPTNTVTISLAGCVPETLPFSAAVCVATGTSTTTTATTTSGGTTATSTSTTTTPTATTTSGGTTATGTSTTTTPTATTTSATMTTSTAPTTTSVASSTPTTSITPAATASTTPATTTTSATTSSTPTMVSSVAATVTSTVTTTSVLTVTATQTVTATVISIPPTVTTTAATSSSTSSVTNPTATPTPTSSLARTESSLAPY
ncbi:cell wall protein DAN4-like [Penaeus chinensis]|uniref:cell wall protein DAN4-like n=1 Tax=Penaeus chinensis TaxID=139456 RepID=UPI001FB80008|nr:cell wall protein DAN4-like [Penaeus chinensis]